MGGRSDKPAGAAGLQRGASMKGRVRQGGARTDQLQSEIDQEHEPSALDERTLRERGAVQPEPPENTPQAREGQADEAGIEIDHARERPRRNGDGF